MTLAQLKSDVSDLIAGGVTLSSSTTPTAVQVTGWLNDGIQYVIDSTNPELHKNLIKIVIKADVEITLDYATFDDPVYKEISIVSTPSAGGESGKVLLLPKDKFDKLVNNPLYGTMKSPVAWRLPDGLWFKPTDKKTVAITYITDFTAMSDDADEPEILAAFHPVLVQYAVYLFYHQQHQPDLEAKALVRCKEMMAVAAHTNGGKSYAT